MAEGDATVQLAHAVASLAAAAGDDDELAVPRQLAQGAVELGLAQDAGVLLTDGDAGLEVAVPTVIDDRLTEVLTAQRDDGPAATARERREPVRVEDLRSLDGRWPGLVRAAAAWGVGGFTAVPMRADGEVLGILGLLHRSAPGSPLVVATALADTAGVLVAQRRRATATQVTVLQLQQALHSRVVIEQAKGMVAAQAGSDPEAAFTHLRGHARRRNQPLAEVARDVIAGRLTASDLAASD